MHKAVYNPAESRIKHSAKLPLPYLVQILQHSLFRVKNTVYLSFMHMKKPGTISVNHLLLPFLHTNYKSYFLNKS